MFGFESAAQAKARRDMAELRSLEAAVHRSQAVIEFDLDGIILSANENFLSVLGYDLGDIQGRHHRMFVDPGEATSPAYADFWRRLNAGEFFVDRFVRYGKDGRRVVIEASYNPLVDSSGRPYKIVKFATDVTAIEAERAQRRENDRIEAEIQARVVRGVRQGLAAMAAGDLTARIHDVFPGEYAELRDDFNQAMTMLDEAFAVVPMAFMHEMGVPRDRMNVHGGACALGHPIGASGARIMVTLLNALERHGLKRGVAAICIGGGEGTAIAIERV